MMAKQGKTITHKKQHFVPQCYTKAWHDPEVPAGPTMSPFVWVFDRDGSNPKRKAPANLFTENDIYTIKGENGNRDLRLEHNFQELEDKFTRIRNLKFNRRKWPDAEEMVWTFSFVATAQARTQANRDHQRKQWRGIRKRMEEFQESFEKASPEKERAFGAMTQPRSVDSGPGITLDHIREMEELPIQHMIGTVVSTVIQAFGKMHVGILCTDDPIGFITTDSPCTWFDPEGYKLPPIYRGPGLRFKTTEVTLPISPSQCLIITHNSDLTDYIDVSQKTIDELNRRHIAHCNSNFISRRNETRSIWFQQRTMPEYSWEHERERKIASSEWPSPKV